MKEAGAGDAVKKEVSAALPGRGEDGAEIGTGMGRGSGAEVGVYGGEAGEVVLAEDVVGGVVGEGEGEGPGAVPGEGREERGADGLFAVFEAREEAVFVGLAESVVAGVEDGRCVLGGKDANAGGQGSVEGAEEVGWGNGRGEGDAGNLSEGVDASVRAAGALRENGFSGDVAEGCGKGALDGGEVGLDLPAVEGGTVVGEGEFPALH